jgi:hypothetical protein
MRTETLNKLELFLDQIYNLESELYNTYSDGIIKTMNNSSSLIQIKENLKELNIMDNLISDIIYFIL